MKNELTPSNLIANCSRQEMPFFSKCKHLSPWVAPFAEPVPEVQVVTCFLQRGDKVLVLQRGKIDAQYQLWGIPGGKLNPSESLLEGLCREIIEETGAVLAESCISLLGSAISKTSTDGRYGLHLYHAKFPEDQTLPSINLNEHLSYQWVTVDQFVELNLLHAQKEAFLFVCHNLLKHMANQLGRIK